MPLYNGVIERAVTNEHIPAKRCFYCGVSRHGCHYGVKPLMNKISIVGKNVTVETCNCIDMSLESDVTIE